MNWTSPVKLSENPPDILNESNIESKKSASKTSSLSTRRRLELGAVLLEEQAQADLIPLDETFGTERKQREMELVVQTQELAAVKREKELEIKIRKLDLESRMALDAAAFQVLVNLSEWKI